MQRDIQCRMESALKRIVLAALVLAPAATGCGTTRKNTRLPSVPDAVVPAAGIGSAKRLAPEHIADGWEVGIRQVIDPTPDAETSDSR